VALALRSPSNQFRLHLAVTNELKWFDVQNIINILVIDDNPVDAMRIQLSIESIEDLAVNVTTLSDYNSFDPSCAANYDLMLLDYYLGDTTGIDFAVKHHLADKLPVIVITSSPSSQLDQRSINSGVTDLLPKKDLSPERLSRRIRYALHNFSRTQALKNQAFYDSLTGLKSRLFFEEHSINSLAKIERTQRPVGIMLIDLDKFKSVNDTYGHLAGDFALVHAANSITDCVRSTDVIGRLGGDEFAICLEGIDIPSLERIANLIISKVSENIEYEGNTLDIGCSIGATLVEASVELPDAIAKADEALYQVKKNGRGHYIFLAMSE